jgi:hypothetical protein
MILSRGGVAKLRDSVSKPTFGLVLVKPPTWHVPQALLNNRFPRFTCSEVIITLFPFASRVTVRVSSSSSSASTPLMLLAKKKRG